MQAVASLPQVAHVEAVDPRPEALQLARQRVAELGDRQVVRGVRWLSRLDDATPGGALCIVATQAPGRSELVRLVAERLGYSSFLVEKLVTQSVGEYERLLDFARRKALAVWVNCKARAHPSHKRVKARLDPADRIVFSVVGGNQGLATNGLHAADLFVFFDCASHIGGAAARVDPLLHPSKRGADIFDLSGTLYGFSPKGSEFVLSFAPDHDAPAYLTIVSRQYRAVIDDMMKWFHESDAASGWSWRHVPFEADLLVSTMTRAFATDILASGRCELPTLEECFPAHRFILDELRPHFNRLLGTAGDRCPVT